MESHCHDLKSFFDAMSSRDIARLETFLDPDVKFDFPGAGVIDGSRRVLVFLKLLFRKYASLVFTVREVLRDGDRACIAWTNEGVTAAGGQYRNSGVTLVHFSGSRIVFLSDYFKDTSFVLR